MSSSLTETDYFSGYYGKFEGRKKKVFKKPERTAKRITKCPKCGFKNLARDYKKAEIYCADCGFVITENIVDLGPEWRFFGFEQMNRVRVGAPMTYRRHDKGLGTLLSRELILTKRSRGLNSKEMIYIFALLEIDRMASALQLPKDIREQAAFLYKDARGRSKEKGESLKGRSTEEMVSAILYIVCKQYGLPRTLKEIAEVSRVEIKRIIRTRRFLSRKFGWKILPSSLADFIPRFCSKLGMSVSVRLEAIEIIEKTKMEIGNGEPQGIAGAAIYTTVKLNGGSCALNKIAAVAGVNYVTIRNRHKEIKKILKKEKDI